MRARHGNAPRSSGRFIAPVERFEASSTCVFDGKTGAAQTAKCDGTTCDRKKRRCRRDQSCRIARGEQRRRWRSQGGRTWQRSRPAPRMPLVRAPHPAARQTEPAPSGSKAARRTARADRSGSPNLPQRDPQRFDRNRAGTRLQHTRGPARPSRPCTFRRVGRQKGPRLSFAHGGQQEAALGAPGNVCWKAFHSASRIVSRRGSAKLSSLARPTPLTVAKASRVVGRSAALFPQSVDGARASARTETASHARRQGQVAT